MKNLKFFLFLLSCCIAVMSDRASAATYYVSPSGDDSNPGTSKQRPWRTIDKVNTVDLNPGDSVLFEADHDYRGNLLLTAEDAGTPTQPVIIGSYGSGRARIKAGDGSGVTVKNVGGVEIRHLIVMGDDYRTNEGSGIKIINALPNKQKLEYIRVHNVAAAGFGREPYQDPFVHGTHNGYGIIVMPRYKDVRITNCTTYKNEHYGIFVSASNLYVGYCKMYDNPGDREYLKNHSGSGILVGGQDIMIEYCEAYNNGYACGSGAGGPVGIWACMANNVVIQHCESHHNRTGGRADGGGFDFDGGVTNSIMQYNYSHDNDGAGYLICSYKDAGKYNDNIVRYNISVNDGQKNNYGGITFWSGSPKDDPIHNTQIYGNTIYNSTGPAVALWSNEGIYNTKVLNNLFVTTNNQRLVEGNPDKSMAIFAGNAYWAVDGKYDIAGYKTLTNWQKATGQEMLNDRPIGLIVDPRATNLGKSPTIGNPTELHKLNMYQLEKNSPLIDAGLDPRSLFGIDPGRRDFYDNPIPLGKGYDIGSHEIVCEDTATPYVAAIHTAAFSGDLNTVKSLIEAGVSPDVKDKWGSTPLHWAAISEDMSIIKLLIAKGADINARNTLENTPLQHLISRVKPPREETVRFFLAKGADLNTQNGTGNTPIHAAVRAGHKDIVELLTDTGANVNAKNTSGDTPLQYAFEHGHKDIAELLITKGAEVSSIFVAIKIGDLARVKVLLEGGTDIDTTDRSGNTPLHYATRGNRDIVELLLAEGANVNAKGRYGSTPLHKASGEGNKDVVALLIAKGADVNARDTKWNETPLNPAAYKGHKEVVELLIAKGANIHVKDKDGYTPLHWAVHAGHRDVAELLIAKNADVNTKGKDSKTPLQIAREKGHTDIVELLRKHGAKE